MFKLPILAYLDAGSASLLLGALAGGAAGLRMFVKSKMDAFRGGSSKVETDADESASSTPPASAADDAER
jgi:hypothetical protein